MLLSFSCDVKRGGGGLKVNVTVMLIFPRIVWKRPLKDVLMQMSPCLTHAQSQYNIITIMHVWLTIELTHIQYVIHLYLHDCIYKV